MKKRLFLVFTLGLLMLESQSQPCLFSNDDVVGKKAAAIEGLKEFNGWIGGWRGIGQPKRGSQQGAWQEKAISVWEIKPERTGIRWNIESGKQWKSAILSHDQKTSEFVLTGTTPDDVSREYRGK
ncbi:MAG: hypothetical protein FJ267_18360, partial [Planctomycetes bacterium]|nr:hypothetical protein [Planctomycetota bacterium]